MNIHGFEVTEAVIDAVIKRMRRETFQSMHIADVVFDQPDIQYHCGKEQLSNGTRWEICHRVADRLIQRERKAGNIALKQRPYWHWIGN